MSYLRGLLREVWVTVRLYHAGWQYQRQIDALNRQREREALTPSPVSQEEPRT